MNQEATQVAYLQTPNGVIENIHMNTHMNCSFTNVQLREHIRYAQERDMSRVQKGVLSHDHKETTRHAIDIQTSFVSSQHVKTGREMT